VNPIAGRILVATTALLAACAPLDRPLPAPPSGAAGVTRAGDWVHLHNDEIVRTFTLRDGAPRTKTVANRLAGGADVELRDAAEFVLTLEGGRKLSDADFAARGWTHESDPGKPARVQSTFHHAATGLTVVVTYTLASGRGVLRKGLSITAEGDPVLIDRVELERFQPARPTTAHAGLGQPVYVGDLFWGCEYPAAENVVQDGTVSLGYLVGLAPDGKPLVTRTAIAGAGRKGDARQSFFDYLGGIQVSPSRPFLVLSTRFDLKPYDEDQAKKSIAGLLKKMAVEYGTPFQAYGLAAGWDTADEPWRPDPARFPSGLAPLKAELGKSGAALGVCLTATGGTGTAANDAKPAPRLCLAENATRTRLLERVTPLLREEGVAFLRLDGFAAPCSDASHGHRAGPYAAVASIDAVIETLRELRRARPDVFLLLGDGFHPSPWWLADADAVWRGGSALGFAEGPRGAPRRERWITHVDTVLHRAFRPDGAQLPLASLAAGAIVQGRLGNDSPGARGTVGEGDEHFSAWEHMAVMGCLRGTHRADLHLSHAATTRDQWTSLTRWLKWAGEREALLARGEMAGGDPAQGEPYAFVHALPERALVVVRNPSDRERLLTLPIDTPPFRFARDRTVTWRSAYPDTTRGAVKPGASWTVTLPPYAVRVVEMEARRQG
jgi:hypothetical protein